MDPTASATPAPPPRKPGEFFLKTAPLPGTTGGRVSDLYLRQNSTANPAVLLTQGPPKFLRASVVDTETGTGVDFTSWAPQHAGRKWGLRLSNGDHDGTTMAGWERVEIAENKGDRNVRFTHVGSEGTTDGVLGGDELIGGDGWASWMVCEWSLGYPQLFWITEQLRDGKLPYFCERVRLVKELL